jgi:hypothetical protein
MMVELDTVTMVVQIHMHTHTHAAAEVVQAVLVVIMVELVVSAEHLVLVDQVFHMPAVVEHVITAVVLPAVVDQERVLGQMVEMLLLRRIQAAVVAAA